MISGWTLKIRYNLECSNNWFSKKAYTWLENQSYLTRANQIEQIHKVLGNSIKTVAPLTPPSYIYIPDLLSIANPFSFVSRSLEMR